MNDNRSRDFVNEISGFKTVLGEGRMNVILVLGAGASNTTFAPAFLLH